MGIIQGVDHLFTGKVERVDVELLQTLLAQGVVPVIPPLGFDGDGKTYRVNSDGVAVAVAERSKPIKLIYITSQDGLINQGHLIRQMLVADLGRLVQQDAAGFPAGDAFEGAARRRGLQRRRAARPRHQRPRGRRPAGRGVLQRRHRHADLRQRIPADPAGQEEGRAGHPVADEAGRAKPTNWSSAPGRPSRKAWAITSSSRSTRIRSRAWRCTCIPSENKGELACLYVRSLAREPGDRAEADPVRREQGAGVGPAANCSPSRRRRSPTSSPRAASSKARRTICRPRAARSTSRAAATRRCS